MTGGPEFSWCDDASSVDDLARFFADNITSSYISHSELQFGRADAVGRWSPRLAQILRSEIGERVGVAAMPDRKVAAAYVEGKLAGIAFVAFTEDVPHPFVVVEDIAIARHLRGHGIGQGFLDWIFARAKGRGIRRAYLESGKDNHDAHHFFERNRFEQVSIVMMAEIA
ncbi:GNAT family N-acetyltransferase [Bradyrhizobium sp. 2TAF24]|uniref:GNAT family N-acetyltransferase n=1 Tax=Bradyrhizobium sp. 2TAF24 TaxID=3233011 RepID=UPI003F8DA8E0